MPITMKRAAYADMFGPTTGDRVRLADTDLIVEVEKDFVGKKPRTRIRLSKKGRSAFADYVSYLRDIIDSAVTER